MPPPIPTPTDALDRMFQVLVRNLRANHPTQLNTAFTVADLYQQILPYRHFRRELGLETNQEYELILMELLTGARGYLDVDERMRDQLGKELHATSPEPSRVREFAEAQVSVNSTALKSVPDARPVAVASSQSGLATPTASSSVPIVNKADASRCRYCGGELPLGRTLHFCPHCGQNLQVLNCPACGAEVEAGWKFCVACGKAVA
jgi:double zinc ribbon protein